MLKGLYSYQKMAWMCSEVQKMGEQGAGGSKPLSFLTIRSLASPSDQPR